MRGLALTSVAFEVLVPLTLTTALFWGVIMPKAREQAERLVQFMARTLKIEPCNVLLQVSLRRLAEMRVGMAAVQEPQILRIILAFNILAILTTALLAVLVPTMFRVPWSQAGALFGEIVAIYAIVLVGQVYFIRNIAFKYSPETADVLFKQVAGEMAVACFDGPVPDASQAILC